MTSRGRTTNRLSLLLLTVIVIFTLTGCSSGSQLKSFVSRQAHYAMTSKDEIPLPKVISDGTSIPVTQSTYCWGSLGCADYVGGIIMVKGKIPTPVVPQATIHITVPYKPAPSTVELVQFLENEKTVVIHLKEDRFNAPKEPGVYYYGISAFWTRADGKSTEGDTSVVFSIEVKA